MAIYDVTVPLSAGMPTYPGEPGPRLHPLKQISRGDSANVTSLFMGAHTGTHVDAPHHFLTGSATIEELPVDALVGPCRLVELPHAGTITAEDLEAAGLPRVERLLLKTSNSSLWRDDEFHSDFAHISGDAARWLIKRGVRLVGIDYLSIEQFRSPTHEVHRTLLASGVVILEGLDLRQVPEGDYFLVCAPLKLVGGDGAPARVFLLDEASRP
ncbi:MAG: cyclase family protein [Chloroflexi bacterium]|nr:cyclase family protein [Chloroflexota bacterium]